MRKIKGRILLIASFVVFISLYLIYDSKGYYYGFGCTFCNNKMPFNLKLHDGSDFSFTLKDDDDFELVGIGFRYATTNFIVKKFLAYGYDDTSVVVKCADSIGTNRYLVSYETGYKTKKGNSEISFRDLSKNDFEQVKEKYKWVEVDEEKASAIIRMKFLFLISALLSLFLLLIKLFPSQPSDE